MRNITLILLLLLPLLARAQSNDNALNKGHALLIHLSYGGHSPGGDLAKRFGSAFGAGIRTVGSPSSDPTGRSRRTPGATP